MNNLKSARNKFKLAQKLLINIDSFVELAENANQELINFIEMINGKSLVKEHIAFDLSEDKLLIVNNIKKYLPELFNQDYIDKLAEDILASYPSLISIGEYDGEKTPVYDNFMQKSYDIYNLDMEDFTNKIFLARIIEIDGYKFIISFVSQFEEMQKDFFLDSLRQLFFYKGFYEFRDNDQVFEMQNFLKKSFLDILIAYTMELTSKIQSKDNKLLDERENNISTKLFSDQDDREIFKAYSQEMSKKYDLSQANIVFIFDDMVKLLGKPDIDLSDPNSYNIEDIIEVTCKNGNFFIDAQIKEVVNILYDFFSFAKNKNTKFEKPFKEIEYVSQNIFTYINYLKNSDTGLYFDQNLLNILGDFKSCKFLDDFYVFVNTITEFTLTFNKHFDSITQSGIDRLAYVLDLEPIKDVKNPKLDHYPIIEYFFNFLNKKALIEGKDKEINFSDGINNFLYLKNKEKMAIFIYYFLDKDFMISFLKESKYEDIISSLVKIITGIKKDGLSTDKLSLTRLDKFSIKLLASVNMIKFDNRNLVLTQLGKDIYDYYLNNVEKNNVININNYLK